MTEDFIQKNLPFIGTLELNSRGGSLSEAMTIGRILRKYYISTDAPSNFSGKELFSSAPFADSGVLNEVSGGMCASACFFVWLGGVNRSGDALWIHRPFPSMEQMRGLSPSDSARLYADMSEKIRVYLYEMDAAPHWLTDMMKIRSDDAVLIPESNISDELTGSKYDLFDLPSLAQWKFPRCGGLKREEFNEFWTLTAQERDSAFSERKKTRLAELFKKMGDAMTCGDNAVALARWQMKGHFGQN